MTKTSTAAPWAGLAPEGPMLRPAKAAEYLGYSTSYFYSLSAQGILPPLIKMGPGHTGASVVPQNWLKAVVASRFAEGVQ